MWHPLGVWELSSSKATSKHGRTCESWTLLLFSPTHSVSAELSPAVLKNIKDAYCGVHRPRLLDGSFVHSRSSLGAREK
jgi:hypothetical protein